MQALEVFVVNVNAKLHPAVWSAENIREFARELKEGAIHYKYKVPVEVMSTLVEYRINRFAADACPFVTTTRPAQDFA